MDDKTKQLLEALASKLGTTTEYLWGILVKQAYIQGFLSLLWSAICISIIVFSILFVKKWIKNRKGVPYDFDHLDYRTGMDVLSGVCIGGSVVSVVIFCFQINTGITCFVNPEYYALQQILISLN